VPGVRIGAPFAESRLRRLNHRQPPSNAIMSRVIKLRSPCSLLLFSLGAFLSHTLVRILIGGGLASLWLVALSLASVKADNRHADK
jgi:hypothetical protein